MKEILIQGDHMSKKHKKSSFSLNGAVESCPAGPATTESSTVKSGTADSGPAKSCTSSASISEDLRLNPEARLCPKFDSESIAKFPVAKRSKMGVRVVDNCAEEHIM